MYQTFYDLVNGLVFNGSAVAGTVQGDALTLVSLCVCIAVIAIPIKVMLRVVDIITGAWR